LRIGYFAQRQVELLDPESSPLEHFKRAAPNQREQVLREYLAGFDFKGEQVMAPTGPFSGGEKARLALALIAWTRPQLLVLDEPTNHLDASARDALTAALAEFDGAILLVSHDRSLLRATVDRFVIVADGQLAPFDGDLDDYRQWLASRESGVNTVDRTDDRPSLASATQTTDRRQERRTVALSREVRQKQLKPLKTRLARIEGELTAAQASVAGIDEQLGNP
jgi:ATP-binding cassette subfamily F protein 3